MPAEGGVRVAGEGPVPCDYAIVGQNPGRVEEVFKRPFMGESGKKLNEWLKEVRLERKAFYITNAVKYSTPKDRLPTDAEIREARPELIEELGRVKPKLILAMGAAALKSLVGKGDVGDNRNKDLRLHRDFGFDARVIGTYHPAAFLRNAGYLGAIKEDLRELARAIRGEYTQITIDYAVDQLPEVSPTVPWYLDVETSAGELILVGMKQPGGLCYLFTPKMFDVATGLLRKALRIIAWQASYDLGEIERVLGLRVGERPVDDPMLMVYILNEEQKQGLKDNAMRLLGVESWEHGIRDRLKRGDPVDPDDLYKYNAKDLTYMELVHKELERDMNEQQYGWGVYQEILIPCIPMFHEMKKRGVYVSEDNIHRARILCATKREAARQKVHAILGDINLNSYKQLGRKLFVDLGLPVVEYTKTGQPSTAEVPLKKIRDRHPVVQDILDYREANKLGEFAEKYQDLRDPQSRVYPTTFTTFTVTGRTSEADPNLQQIPRNHIVRSIIAAPPGRRLIIADQSQVEFRLGGHIAREPNIIRAYSEGKDVHTMMAALIRGVPEGAVTKADRNFAKPINYGFEYGAEEQTFIDQALRDFDVVYTWPQAHEYRELFFKLWSGFPGWYKEVWEILDRQEYVETMFGRRRHLPAIHSTVEHLRVEALRMGINFLVQSAANDIMLLCAIMLYEFDAPLIQYIHDSVILECDEEQAESWAQLTKDVMEKGVLQRMKNRFGIELSVPLVADVKIVQEWQGDKIPGWELD
jgi:uracil-DNA glycosylase family 4